jgi:aspartate/methionine/tyrosine aminotransferase
MPAVAEAPATRASCLETESAFIVAARVRELRAEGRDIADLSIGEPDLPTPECIVEAGARALRDGATRYTPPAGLPALRAAIADDLSRWDIAASADDVFITPGAKPALLYVLLATVSPGDEVLVPDPGFAPYTSQVRLAGATPVAYPVGCPADHVTPRTRAIILNSPANPTGAALGLAELAAIADLAEQHDLVVIADEIYARIWFGSGDRAPSVARLPGRCQRTIIVDGFSKAWRMTGWRLGHAVVPRNLRTTFERLAVNAHSCVPGFIQHAGVAALQAGDDLVREYVDQLRARRDTLVDALNALPGVSCATPAGAFYAFPDCSHHLARIGQDDVELQQHLLEIAGVATLAGSTFGAEGAGHLRLSFAAPETALEEAVPRLRTTLPNTSTRPHFHTPILA